MNTFKRTIKAAVRSPYYWRWIITTMGGALSALFVSQLILLFAFRLPFLQGYGFGVALGLSLGAYIGGFQWWFMIQFVAFVVGQIMLNGLILGAVTGVPMSRFLQQEDEKRQP